LIYKHFCHSAAGKESHTFIELLTWFKLLYQKNLGGNKMVIDEFDNLQKEIESIKKDMQKLLEKKKNQEKDSRMFISLIKTSRY